MDVDAVTIVYLPEGPTAYFKLTSIEMSKKIHVSSPSTSPIMFRVVTSFLIL